MKNLIYTLVAFGFLILPKLSAQNNLNHPTISSIKVMYKSVPQTTTVANQALGFELKAIPNATINLVGSANVSKVYFKIINAQTNVILYDVNYQINSGVILNTEGKKLFENINGVLFISPGQSISLKPYTYQITTEDSQQIMSPVYSVIQ